MTILALSEVDGFKCPLSVKMWFLACGLGGLVDLRIVSGRELGSDTIDVPSMVSRERVFLI